jgi:hypothetical protein
MIRQIYSNSSISLEPSQNSQQVILFPKSTRNSKFSNNQINSLEQQKRLNTSSNKRTRNTNYSQNYINKSFSKEPNRRLITQSNQNFLKEFEIYKQNINKKRINSSKNLLNFKKVRRNNFMVKEKNNYTDIRPKKLDKELNSLVQKKMLLLKDINQLRKEKKTLININQQNVELKHKINILEKDIDKFKEIIKSCQKNYIDLSYEYTNIKSNLEKITRNININK